MPNPALSPASAPYDFSPATTAALVALVAGKADDGQFVIGAAPTALRLSGYAPKWGTPRQGPDLTFPPHAALLVRPRTPAAARLYTWQLVYRRRRQGCSLVADAAQDSIARGMLAQAAIDWMNALDMRYPVRPSPNPTPDVAGLALDPRGRVVGQLLGYVGPKVGP